MQEDGMKKVLKYGIACYKKKCMVQVEESGIFVAGGRMPSHFLNVVQNPLSLENPVAKAISRTGRAADLGGEKFEDH